MPDFQALPTAASSPNSFDMIVFDLQCQTASHRFEGWFKSSDDFAAQQGRGLLVCPQCGSSDVGKAVQAPRLGRKGNQVPQQSRRPAAEPTMSGDSRAATTVTPPPQAAALIQALAAAQAEVLKSSRYVGETFAEDARAMHYGEKDSEVIHGRASLAEARELYEEGIGIMPLLIPVTPPEQAN